METKAQRLAREREEAKAAGGAAGMVMGLASEHPIDTPAKIPPLDNFDGEQEAPPAKAERTGATIAAEYLTAKREAANYARIVDELAHEIGSRRDKAGKLRIPVEIGGIKYKIGKSRDPVRYSLTEVPAADSSLD